MPIDPKLMAVMGNKAPPGGAQGATDGIQGLPGGGVSPPVSSPMSTPQPNEGEKQGAKIKVQQAMDLLEQALPEFGAESEEGGAVLQVLSTLGKKFGGEDRARSKELMPAELMNLMAAMPRGPGGMKPPMPGGGAGGPPGGMPPPGGGMPPPGGGMPPPPM